MRSLPPGPAEPPALQTLRWLLRPVAFLESCRRRFGDAFSVRFLGFASPMVMVSDPEAIKGLYGTPEHRLPPGRGVALLPIMGPRSVLLLEGAEHLARRRLMLPQFHGARVRAYEPLMRALAEREVAAWPRDGAFAVHPRMQAVTLEIILHAVFGVTDEERRARLRERLRRLLDSTASPALQFRVLLGRGPDPLAALRALRREIDGLLLAEIAERRRDPAAGERDDILSMLVGARFEDGEPMSDAEVCDQLVTLLVAGHETTATALAWTLELLVHHPPALARLERELREDPATPYLRAVVSEALRLRPVVPIAGRRLASELRADGHVLPPGTDVTPAIWLAHTRPDRYPDPYAFRPERFLEQAPSTYAWVPFGGGVRRCLGAAFAELELRVVLATVVRLRALSAGDPAPERIARRNVTFSPRHGTRVVATPRSPITTAARSPT